MQSDADVSTSLRSLSELICCNLLTNTPRHELQARLNNGSVLSNITVLGVDPGAMVTGLARRGSLIASVITRCIFPLLAPLFVWLWPNGYLRTPKKSASDVMRAALDTETLGERPKDVYLNGTDPWPTSQESKQQDKRTLLWQECILYASVDKDETALKTSFDTR
jgi:hypothetical protein